MSNQAQMDAAARQQGFPDYVTMLAWQNHISQSLRTPQNYMNGVGRSGGPASPPTPQADQKNVSNPPSSSLGWLADIYHRATGF